MKHAPFVSILLAVLLVPLFFMPSSVLPFLTGKNAVFAILAALGAAAWVFLGFRNRSISVPPLPAIVAGAGLLAVLTASAIAGSNMAASFAGQGAETGTIFFMLAGILLMLLSTVALRTKERLGYVYAAVFAVFAVSALYQLVRIFGGSGFLSFGIFTAPTSALIGSWNDLGIFFGLAAILALAALDSFPRGRMAAIMYGVLAVAVGFLALINFSLVWILIALAAAVFFLSAVFVRPEQGARRGGIAPVAILVLSVLFFVGGDFMLNSIAPRLGISFIDVRPSWGATLEVGSQAFKENLFLGAGPNRFIGEWLRHKPESVNRSLFWNIDFTSGVGFIPTSIIETGLAGVVAWSLFLAVVAYAVYRGLRISEGDRLLRYFMRSSAAAAAYLWIFAFLYVPGPVHLMLAFCFTGILFGFSGVLGTVRTVPFEEGRRGVLAGAAGTFVLVAVLAVLYGGISRAIGSFYLTRATLAFSNGKDLDAAERAAGRAAVFGFRDSAYRLRTEAGLARMGVLIGTAASSEDELVRNFKTQLDATLLEAGRAIGADRENYANWTMLGRVYESLVSLKVAGAYDNARAAYQEALKRNPRSPELRLVLARLEAANGHNDAARVRIAEALTLKNNYAAAILFLSQLELSEGNTAGALASVEAATLVSPQDATLFFELGRLRYLTGSYQNAVGSLEHAVSLNPAYANARYFLALAYSRVGRTDDAVRELEALLAENPESAEVKTALDNVRNGRAAEASDGQ
jgi:tetratricopeptide (TPR) repeat protein